MIVDNNIAHWNNTVNCYLNYADPDVPTGVPFCGNREHLDKAIELAKQVIYKYDYMLAQKQKVLYDLVSIRDSFK